MAAFQCSFIHIHWQVKVVKLRTPPYQIHVPIEYLYPRHPHSHLLRIGACSPKHLLRRLLGIYELATCYQFRVYSCVAQLFFHLFFTTVQKKSRFEIQWKSSPPHQHIQGVATTSILHCCLLDKESSKEWSRHESLVGDGGWWFFEGFSTSFFSYVIPHCCRIPTV